MDQWSDGAECDLPAEWNLLPFAFDRKTNCILN